MHTCTNYFALFSSPRHAKYSHTHAHTQTHALSLSHTHTLSYTRTPAPTALHYAAAHVAPNGQRQGDLFSRRRDRLQRRRRPVRDSVDIVSASSCAQDHRCPITPRHVTHTLIHVAQFVTLQTLYPQVRALETIVALSHHGMSHIH